ncbi:MAG: hypothetical protein ACOC80_03825 [Petrotogales bacterium]
MKRVILALMILFIAAMLVKLPDDSVITVSGDEGSNYPCQPTDEEIIQALDYLRNQQTEDGSIESFSSSSWAAMAIAATGEHPHDWGNLVEYIRENVDRIDKDSATDWERQLLAVVACDENPLDFGGIDYVAQVESFYDGEQIGSPVNLYDDFFGIISLISGGIDNEVSIIQTVRAFIKEKQQENGGWGDADSTAAAIMALIAAGEDANSDCILDALSFIKSTQVENGGFQSWGTSNAASTAWAVSAIVATGRDPSSDEWITIIGNSPIEYLLSLQQDNGCFNWTEKQTKNPEWMTSYVIPALLGKPYPIKIFEPENGGNEHQYSNNDNTEDEDDTVFVDRWRGYIRIEGQTDTIWNGEVTVANSTINALNDSSGEIEEYLIPYPSVLGALDEASQLGGFSYFVIYYPSWDAFYVKTIEDEPDWWHYWIDYVLPLVGVGTYELTDNDEEILFGYLEDWTARALRITVNKDKVNISEEFTVGAYNETMAPVENAVVYVNSTEYMTDENGTVTIDINASGEYEIYSEKEGYVRSERIMIHVKKMVEIITPADNSFYLLNRKLVSIQKTIIVGHIDIEVNTIDKVKKVEFYLNDKHEHTDTERPFKWRLNKRAILKKEMLKVKAYANVNDMFLKIQKIIQYIDALMERHPEMQALTSVKIYLENLGKPVSTQTDVDEKEILVFNLFPRLHIL